METSGAPKRLTSIDAVRGFVMIIMALDHVRDYLHSAALVFSPTDLTRTTPLLFFTRWITHFCAPVFMFTAGLGAFFWWQRNRTRKQLSVFLLTRGLWLLVLELTVMRWGLTFGLSLRYPIVLLVLWSIGASMIAFAALAWLPIRWLAVLSLAMIGLHNLLDRVQASNLGAGAPLWNVIHQQGVFVTAGITVIVGYPLVPWIGILAAGFCCGRVFLLDLVARRRGLLAIGGAATVAFIVIRAINVYGDPAPWSAQKSGVYTVLSFLNCTKYPPSLEFLLMTLGPALLVLAWFERLPFNAANPLIVFGRVPLFYFVIHFYLAHLGAAFLNLIFHGRAAFDAVLHPFPAAGAQARPPAAAGFDLWVVYAVWTGVVIVMYPLCRWFARIKATRRDWWLSYL